MMRLEWLTSRRMLWLMWGLVAFEVFCSVFAAFRNYSGVPFGDTWDTIAMLNHFNGLTWEGLWGQHNEHRIVLARLLIWMDLNWLDGTLVFLTVCNYLLAGSSAFLFCLILREQIPDNADRVTRQMMMAVVIAMLFFWRQRENLVWEFQSQFFLAQLLPLLVFYLLYQAKEKHGLYLIPALLVALLCAGTMANGVLVYPLLFLMAWMIRLPWYALGATAFLLVAVPFAYLQHYHAPGHHGSLDTVMAAPVEYIYYVVSYLGNPFQAILPKRFISACAGVVMIAGTLYFTIHNFFSTDSKDRTLRWVLIAFIGYVMATALVTGVGRSNFGVEQALSSRYATPTLMAWVSLLLLCTPYLVKQAKISQKRLSALFIIVLAMLPYQINGLRNSWTHPFDKNLAIVAIQMGVHDKESISHLYPSMDHVFNVSEGMRVRNQAMFADPKFYTIPLVIGTKDTDMSSGLCEGAIYDAMAIPEDEKFVRIEGFLMNEETKEAPNTIHILSRDRTVIGYALMGKKDPHGKRAGFEGYMLSEYRGVPVILKGFSPSCEVSDGQ